MKQAPRDRIDECKRTHFLLAKRDKWDHEDGKSTTVRKIFVCRWQTFTPLRQELWKAWTQWKGDPVATTGDHPAKHSRSPSQVGRTPSFCRSSCNFYPCFKMPTAKTHICRSNFQRKTGTMFLSTNPGNKRNPQVPNAREALPSSSLIKSFLLARCFSHRHLLSIHTSLTVNHSYLISTRQKTVLTFYL